ncbi:MAG: type I-E CRISPR-associated protein Cas6/Cse3/CasE [Chloroflexota bacterium]
MYLSRLTLNQLSAQVRAELAHPYEMHRTLSRGFPKDTFNKTRNDGECSGVLFRVDESPRDHRIVVLVQSQVAPDWTYLNDKRDVRGHAYLLQPPESKLLELKLAAGQTFAFRLHANPTKRLGKSAGEKKGKRVGIRNEEKQFEWLQRKAEQGGFRVVRAMVSRKDRIKDNPKEGDDRSSLDFLAAQFDGVLLVRDPDLLIKAVRSGIGSAKGLGFGLLSLAPVRG